MIKHKSSLAVLLLTCAIFILSGCQSKTDDAKNETSEPTTEQTEVADETKADLASANIASLKGPTTMGLVQLISDSEEDENSNYDFTIAATADEVVGMLAKGDIDIAAIPSNLASVLYNKKNLDISVMAINTLGVQYIVDTSGEISSIDDLKGKTILSTGKGTVPEYILRHILTENGIDPDVDVDLQFKSEPTEVLSLLGSGEAQVAMLPQPFVTVATSKNENLKVALSLSEEWGKIAPNSDIVTGVVVARNEYLESNEEAVNDFLAKYKASTEFVNSNPEEASVLVEKYGIAPAAVAQKAIPQCNIVFLQGDEMQSYLSAFLEVLMNQNPEAIGGKLPDENFYYKK